MLIVCLSQLLQEHQRDVNQAVTDCERVTAEHKNCSEAELVSESAEKFRSIMEHASTQRDTDCRRIQQEVQQSRK